jgi:hypothetical protein
MRILPVLNMEYFYQEIIIVLDLKLPYQMMF